MKQSSTPVECVTFKGASDSRARSVWLEITRESERFLCGIELQRDGAPLEGRGFDERVRVIEKGAIRRRRIATMNRHYGELEIRHD